jgi:hypothetical protein
LAGSLPTSARGSERKTGAGGTYGQIGAVGANAADYSDGGLVAGTTYCYRVRAYNDSGDSGYSPEAAAATPLAAVRLRAGAASAGLWLTWPTVPGADYELYTTTNLLNPAWTVVTEGRAVLSNLVRGSLPPATGTRFFTLRKGAQAGIGYAGGDGLPQNMSYQGAWLQAARFDAAADLTVTTVKARLNSVAGRWKCAIYSANGAGGMYRFLRGTAELYIAGVTDCWVSFPLTAPLNLVQGQSYYLVLWTDAADGQAQFYRTAGAGTMGWLKADYGEWPAQVSGVPTGDYAIAVCAE